MERKRWIGSRRVGLIYLAILTVIFAIFISKLVSPNTSIIVGFIDLFASFALPLILALLFYKSHIFAALIYGIMLFLMIFRMTIFAAPITIIFAIVSVVLFLILYYMERRWKVYLSNGLSRRIVLSLLGLFRIPINYFYIQDIIYRLQNWKPIPSNFEGVSIGGVIGGFLLFPIVIVIILSFVLLLIYIFKLIRIKRNEQDRAV